MTPVDRRAFLMSGLQLGVLDAAGQVELFAAIDARDIEFKVMRTTLDEIYQNEREQDEIDRRMQAEADRMARIKAAGNVEMFPTLLRRPMPSVPPIQAIEERL